MFKKLFGGKDKEPVDERIFEPRMPEVETGDSEEIFTLARQHAAEGTTPDGTKERHVVVVTPGRMLMMTPCPPPGSMPQHQVAGIEKMLPPSTPRKVAVIAYNGLDALVTDKAKAIPFLGVLLGLAYIGHAVWVFEGHPSALAAGCRSADLLLVDGAMLPHLPPNWATLATSVMRRPEIYIHDRDTFGLRPYRAE